ncbi:MAG: glycosyltransferase family 39 protein [Patescibacteria group bacterium]
MTKHQKIKIFAAVMIIIASILAITSAWDDSVIVDEVPHIGAGYSYLVKQDMRLNPEHPPLAKDLAAIPLFFLNLKQDAFQTRFWQSDLNGQWEFGRSLMFGSGNDADLIKHAAKLPMLVFFVLAAVLVFVWSRRLYGDLGAIIALILFSFSTTIMAHARFVTTDVPALFGVLLATYFFIKFLHQPSRKNILISGLTLGIALLTKFSTFLLIPYFILLVFAFWLIYKSRPPSIVYRLLSVLIIAFIFIIWPVYYFHTYNYPPERQRQDTETLLSSFGNRTAADAVVWLSDKPVIRALGQYGLGLLMVTQRATGGNTTYFLGEVSASGWKNYFPVVYFLKEPLAWWGLVIIALAATMTKLKSLKFKEWLRNHFVEFAMLLWLVIYWGTSIKGNLNIGVRHLLPTYSFAIILVSGQVAKSIKYLASSIKRKVLLNTYYLILATLLGWYVFENLSVYPYYLTYFNQAGGGPSGGYRYVVDSNLDWGQDLLRLGRWVKENNIQKIELDYFGWADPAYYLGDRFIWLTSSKYKDAADFIGRNQSDGWLAVSATFLQGSRGTPDKPAPINYDNWLKARQPVTVIGNSIFVYQIK